MLGSCISMDTYRDFLSFVKHSDTEISALDIGCSGYIPNEWLKFDKALSYFGVDPLISEISLLKARNASANYLEAFVRASTSKGKPDQMACDFFERTSASFDIKKGNDHVKEQYNSGREVVYSGQVLTPWECLEYFHNPQIDILKIDVDGDDYSLLYGFLMETQESFGKNLLAFQIESQFHGDMGESGNTFENIMRIAREFDFHLYKLEPYTYSRYVLPQPYLYEFPAQTYGGQVMWGEAFFAKDGLSLNDKESIGKLIRIYQAYGLEDCAYESFLYLQDKNPLSDFAYTSSSAIEETSLKNPTLTSKLSRRIYKAISELKYSYRA